MFEEHVVTVSTGDGVMFPTSPPRPGDILESSQVPLRARGPNSFLVNCFA